MKDKILHIISKISGKLPNLTGPAFRVNLLTYNLEKIELTHTPFVSIHIALYNEKRVVERLIKAATSQDYVLGTIDKEQLTSDKSNVRLSDGQVKGQMSNVSANYEVIIADDSTDETTSIAYEMLTGMGYQVVKKATGDQETGKPGNQREQAPDGLQSTAASGSQNAVDREIFIFTKPDAPKVTIIHRFTRSGYKGAALHGALEATAPEAEYIAIFDADFVPYPDTLTQFVKAFKALSGNQEVGLSGNQEAAASLNTQIPENPNTRIAAVQGYQWHVLNKSQTWVTRGVRTEYAGSYVMERAGEEIYGGLKQISGSVYCIRADVLRQFGWGKSITEDFELTLRLYIAGYKVAFTPYIQAPAEAVSTIKRLVRQRMRWAEGSSYNIKVMLPQIIKSKHMTRAEKMEFLYFAPYYLQAAFFIFGTFSWFVSETLFGARLPFWSPAFGWSLVFTNLLALPLMNIVGLFLEESDERDYVGILSFIALSYIVVPFQAYAAIKGFIETKEGPWFRTPKTGLVTDTISKSAFSKFFGNVLGKKPAALMSKVEGLKTNVNLTGTFNLNLPIPASKLAFSHAYNPLNASKLRVRPRYTRYFGNLALAFVVITTISMSILTPFMPQTSVAASQQVTKTLKQVEEEKQKQEQKQEEQQSIPTKLQKEDEYQSFEQITEDRLIRIDTEKGGVVEYIFSKDPKVRVKADGREITFETKEIGGRSIKGNTGKISEQKVVYENVLPNIDIKYSINEGLITEEFILKNRDALNLISTKISQNVQTVGVKVVSPNPTVFGFYTNDNEEFFQLSQPFAKDDYGQVSNDFTMTLEKDRMGYKLIKHFGDTVNPWLNDPKRVFPISIDPSVIVTGLSSSSLSIYGGLQRKIAYVNGSWYAIMECDFLTDACSGATTPERVYYSKSSDGSIWGAETFLSSTGTDLDNFNPSISVSGNFIHVAWFDGSADAIEFLTIDTGSSDALTGECTTADQGTIDTTTFMVTIAAFTSASALIAYSDTSTDAEVDIFYVEGITGGTCTPTIVDVGPGNMTFGSGITAGDRPVVFPISSCKAGMIFQDGNLSYSEFDCDSEDWTTNNMTIASVTDNIYSVTSDKAATPKIWILTANISDATDTNFYTCCTTDFATTTIDADVGAAGNDNVSDVDMYCPAEDNCKIVYTDDIDTAAPRLMFVDCNDTTCSSPTVTQLDGDIGTTGDSAGPSIYCVASDDCKVAAGNDVDGASGDLLMYDCISDEDCSTNVIGTPDTDIDDGTGTVILHTSIYCPASDDCKLVYNDDALGDFDFVDCANTACSSSTLVTVDGGAAAEPKNDISCSTGAADCKIVYHDSATSDFTFVDCTAAAACATVFDVDGTVGATTGQVPSSIWCPAGDGTDCRVAFGAQDLNDFHIVDCGSTACSASNTITTVDGNGGADATNDPTISMDCIAVNDCKVTYVGDLSSASQNLYILDCDANACTSGSVIEIGSSSRYGAAIKCPTTTNCKIAYYGGGSGGTPTLVFLDCDVTNCFPSVTDDTDPWQATGSNIETVTLTYRSDNSSLYASIIQDASDQAYYKSTSVSSISWSGQTSWGFTAGQLNEISSPESVSSESQVSVVLNRTDSNGNYEFANIPEYSLYLALTTPFIFKKFTSKRKDKSLNMKC